MRHEFGRLVLGCGLDWHEWTVGVSHLHLPFALFQDMTDPNRPGVSGALVLGPLWVAMRWQPTTGG